MYPPITKKSFNPTIHQLNSGNFPFINNQISDARKTHDLEVHNTAKSLFRRETKERETQDLPKLISYILFMCDLRSILILRLVSKGFYYLASSTNAALGNSFFLGIPYNHLTNKAIASFQFGKFCPTIDASMQAKFDFAQNNTLKCNLKIKDFNELALLQSFLLDPSNNKTITTIEVLDFKELPINKNTIGLINTLLIASLSYNQNLIPNLNTIVLGDIIESCMLVLPESFNPNTTLTIGNITENNSLQVFGLANNLLAFSIGNVEQNASFKLLTNLKHISALTIGDLHESSTLILPKMLDALTTLIIGEINKSSLELPDSLNNLTTLTIGYTVWCTIKLPNSLNNLENLRIGMGSGGFVQLPNSLNNLTSLFMSKSHGTENKIAMQLPNTLDDFKALQIENIFRPLPDSLNNLTTLVIEILEFNLTLANRFHNLKSLRIDRLRSNFNFGVTLEIADALINLEILNIGLFSKDTTLKLSNSLNNLTRVAIGGISGAKITLPELKNLTTLIIGDIYSEVCSYDEEGIYFQEAELILPHSLNNLIILIIGSLDSGSIVKLPLTLNNLRICTIKKIGDNVTLEFPNILDQLTSLTFGYMGENSSLKLPESLDNLINLTLGKISPDAQIQLPTSINNLTQLVIEEKFDYKHRIYFENTQFWQKMRKNAHEENFFML